MQINSRAVLALAATVAIGVGTSVSAGAADYSKKEYNFSPWTKGRFAEMVTVAHPGKFISVAGIGAESEKDGHTLYPGDMLNQCRYAVSKIKKDLATEGATFANLTRMVIFLTDMGGGTRESAKPYADFRQCMKEAFTGFPLTASTVVQITRLAAPDMLIEIDVDAMLP